MAYRVQLSLPRVVERGEQTTLNLPVRDDADAEQTATLSGSTVTIYLGSKKIVDAAAIATVGPPASYTVSAAATADEGLTDEWLEVWTLAGLDTFRVRGHLVRHQYHSRVTDAALQDVHPEFLLHLPPGETTGERFRRRASEQMQRRLLAKGRRPWLVFDSDALFDPEVWLTLALWAEDAALRQQGNTEWARLANSYHKRYEDCWAEVSFSYDENEDGVIDADENGEATQAAAVMLTAGRPRVRSWR